MGKKCLLAIVIIVVSAALMAALVHDILELRESGKARESFNNKSYQLNYDTINKCIDKHLPKYSENHLYAFHHATSVCSNLLFYSLDMKDYEIRKEKFRNQEKFEPYIIAIVMAITACGVYLSYYQIRQTYSTSFDSYSVLNRDSLRKKLSKNELRVAINEQFKFTLRSSVTGLAILIVSFAFFIVYLEYVYELDPIYTERSEKARAAINTGLSEKPIDSNSNSLRKSPFGGGLGSASE